MAAGRTAEVRSATPARVFETAVTLVTLATASAQPLRLSADLTERRILEEAVRRCTGARPAVGGLAPSKDGPGPAIYDGGTSIGDQLLSKHKTAPVVTFGTAMRGHTSDTNERDGPGPAGYVVPSTLGPAVDSRYRSAPSYTLAGREQFGSTTNVRRAAKEPGPGDYNVPSDNPYMANPPKITIARRHQDPARRDRAPGPGSYRLPQSVGPQVESTKHRASSPLMGSGKRPPLHLYGLDHNNGPGQYRTVSAMGPQLLSSFDSAPAVGFGSSTRPLPHGQVRPAPGPGRYKPECAIGKQVRSNYKTMPVVTLKSRTKFGSPYG